MLTRKLEEFVHGVRLRLLEQRHGQTYRVYLRTQFERSYSKRHLGLQVRTIFLADKLIEYCSIPGEQSLLCVGCRNVAEIRYFQSKGVSQVIGIDLFSESRDILVMDMHALKFPAKHFTMIYASHSLEHAYDLDRVITEMARVCRPGAYIAVEMPVHYSTSGADRIDIGDVSHLNVAFSQHKMSMIWCDDQLAFSDRNPSGTDIVRAIFRVL